MNSLPALPRSRGLTPAAPEVKWWPYTDDAPATSGTQHFHWGVVAFSRINSEGLFEDSCRIEVEASCEADAIARAMHIIQRNGYRIEWVREACSADKEVTEHG
jgi:hypothetical protein